MALTLLLGGARSGKSALAARIATSTGGRVAVIATAEALDEEMADRIDRHREARPDDWEVVEEPRDLLAAMGAVPGESRLIIDCLTLWVSNLVGDGLDDPRIEDLARRAAAAAAARPGQTVAVTNEVGSGIVPMNDLARRYRDLLGRVNTIWASEAASVYLTVAGGVVPVQREDALWDGPA